MHFSENFRIGKIPRNFFRGFFAVFRLCCIEKGIDEDAFARLYSEFARLLTADIDPPTDGHPVVKATRDKFMRGTTLANGRWPDIVSIYDVGRGIATDTEACQEKSNEIKATPRLIERASFELGCVVTADAMNCQTNLRGNAQLMDYISRKHWAQRTTILITIDESILLMQFAERAVGLHLSDDAVDEGEEVVLTLAHQHTNLAMRKWCIQQWGGEARVVLHIPRGLGDFGNHHVGLALGKRGWESLRSSARR